MNIFNKQLSSPPPPPPKKNKYMLKVKTQSIEST